jgi:predicted transcriptional regulator
MLLLLEILGIAVGIAVVLFCLDRLCLYLERHRWIYYRRTKPKSGAVSSMFLEMQSFIDPTAKHVIEHREEEQEAEAKSDVGELLQPQGQDDAAPDKSPNQSLQLPGRPSRGGA